jgi:hypothetical protein
LLLLENRRVGSVVAILVAHRVEAEAQDEAIAGEL